MKLENEVIQLSHPDDLKKLAELYAEIAMRSPPAFFNWSEASALSEVRIAKNYVVIGDQQIQAFLTFRENADRIEIMAIATASGFKKMGLATQLLKKLKFYATQQIKPIGLEVHESNQDAIKLYVKQGFKPIHRRKSYYSDGASAVVMTWDGDIHIQS